MKRRWHRIVLRWHLTYGGILLALEGLKEMDEACKTQS